MSVFRVNKNQNYTVMSNYHFKEQKMSLKAKGLLSLMLSLPNDWDYSIAGLVTLSSDGESSVRTALQELEKFGYLKRTRTRKDGKLDDIIYDIYETPQGDFLNVENLKQENLILENQVQLNTNKINNLNNKNTNNKCVKPKTSKKDKIFKMLEKKCLEYDIDEDVITKLEEFYDVLLENNKLVTQQKIDADLSNLAKVNFNKQLQTIQTALDRGWQSLNPEWLNNQNKASYNTQSKTTKTLEEIDESLRELEEKGTKF